ncbi:DUF4181 domain-containing protein [Paenibacillus marinisediminis]
MVATIAIGFISIILALSDLILRKWIAGTKKVELPDEGKKVEKWGKIILATIGIITVIIFLDLDILDADAMKWFWMVVIITAFGFQSFIDWKYLKGSKLYIVSLINLILGVILVYFLL